MKHLSLLIKPSSSLCNMKCKYCFYHSLADEREVRSYGLMSEKTAESIIKEAFKAAARSVHFAFQGGEPTLIGLEFYKKFIQIVNELNPGLEISYSLQTNGLTVNDDFALFLKENSFLVGLSIDGTRDIHDFLRLDSAKKGTYGRVIKTARLFDKLHVQYNILVVMSSFIAKHIEKVYNSLKKEGFKYLQFIPCLDELDKPLFENSYSLTPELYAESLKQLFMLYYKDYFSGKYISIRYFDNLIFLTRGQNTEMCGMLGYCAGQFVIEGDGTVFPCDFYCVDNWVLGNINELSLEELYESENMNKFIKSSIINDEKCKICDVFALCRGGCRRHRDHYTNGKVGENIYCDALKEFLTFASPYLKRF